MSSCIHSHNDFDRARPLFDALEHGACSIEADIHLAGGELLVAHESNQVVPGRTLESLYLDPLAEMSPSQKLTLIIDVKTDAAATYAVLRDVLAGHAALGVVNVVISGNRAIDSIAAEPMRIAGVDARISELESGPGSDVAPLVSDDWQAHFTWVGGIEPMPAMERAKLRTFVATAHGQGRRMRFWGTFDLPEVWTELADAGVDLIGTDDPAKLETFLQSR